MKYCDEAHRIAKIAATLVVDEKLIFYNGQVCEHGAINRVIGLLTQAEFMLDHCEDGHDTHDAGECRCEPVLVEAKDAKLSPRL